MRMSVFRFPVYSRQISLKILMEAVLEHAEVFCCLQCSPPEFLAYSDKKYKQAEAEQCQAYVKLCLLARSGKAV